MGGGIQSSNEKNIAEHFLDTDKAITPLVTKISEKKTKKTKEGQTQLDVSLGNVRINQTGASGGGLSEAETELNPNGYYITGKTRNYNVVVAKGVKTDLTLDNVEIESNSTTQSCVVVSHAEVTITLKGVNKLGCNYGQDSGYSGGAALAKDGMDGFLTLQCEYADQEGHQCNDRCGTLIARGNTVHAGAIGSTLTNVRNISEAGFCNFSIKGGNIDVNGGRHVAGIGAACETHAFNASAYTKNISISGGNIKAIGTEYGPGIGGGYGGDFDGLYITGGKVEAQGGLNAPGIGASAAGNDTSYNLKNVHISGGDTVVIAIGDKSTGMPGIGAAGGNEHVSNVTAEPDTGYQGYVQDGTSLEDYSFMEGTPFHEKINIRVGKLCTKVYFGPFRDANGIEDDTKEQIGANHVISKSGGKPFTEDLLRHLTKVTGKQEDGTSFPEEQLTLADPAELETINDAKTKGEIGDFPLTYTTPNGTSVTVTIFLKSDGEDAGEFEKDNIKEQIGANDFTKETGGSPFSEEDIKKLGEVKGKDKDGNNISLDDFSIDQGQFKVINEHKTQGKAGKFELTYFDSKGNKVTVTVTLVGEFDAITENPDTSEMIKGKNIISKTGGAAFTNDQLKKLSMVKAVDKDGGEISAEDISFANEGQVTAINKAKLANQIGDFPLTFRTPENTEVTITVFLRDEGADAQKPGQDEAFPVISANHMTHPTKGDPFTEEQIIELCKAKGKDKNADNARILADQKQLQIINEAKTKGKTGVFDLTFSLADGNKATVKVTLTGDHKISFDPDGGDYKPEDQIVKGGECAVPPQDPKKDGYVFEGWYYVDEKGQEIQWDFKTPIHEDIKLKARWKEESKAESKAESTAASTASSTLSPPPSEKKQPKKKQALPEWEYRKRADGVRVSKTGDDRQILCLILIFGAALTGTAAGIKKRKK
ncbi:MAG: InlB B-repeat-containing protein [Anaerostipes sp.]|nr:InlB B-repeat-containing protein [Anaerostipes sp.]